MRTLTTESLAVFMPFRVQEIAHEHGIYYGQNVISNNMIIADRKKLLNGNSFVLGVPGAGKSFIAKNEIVNLMIGTDADIIIIAVMMQESAGKGKDPCSHRNASITQSTRKTQTG